MTTPLLGAGRGRAFRRMLKEQCRKCCAQPPVSGVVVIARVPVLLDREDGDWHRAGMHLESSELRQRLPDVSGQRCNQIGRGQNRTETEKAGQLQRDLSAYTPGVQCRFENSSAGPPWNIDVFLVFVRLEGERPHYTGVPCVREADPILWKQHLLVDPGFEPRDEPEREVGLAAFQCLRGITVNAKCIEADTRRHRAHVRQHLRQKRDVTRVGHADTKAALRRRRHKFGLPLGQPS